MHAALAFDLFPTGNSVDLRNLFKSFEQRRPSMSWPIGRSRMVRIVGAISIRLAP